jgi:tRNA threonylcarbamoyladenosine biosynthesis protein TsaE
MPGGERLVPESRPFVAVLDLADETATVALAVRLAPLARAGDVIALRGDFGSGKTTFARAFIRARGAADEEVPSPTFTLVQIYPAVDPTAAPVHHFDLFRIDSPEECRDLGIEDAFTEAICLIEWPERLGALLPAERLDLALAFGRTPQARIATLTPAGDWRGRLRGAGLV